MTVTPSKNLKSGEKVTISAKGFSPKEALAVIECANKGTSTSQADCDLTALVGVESNSAGDVHATYTVTKGPFGSGHIVCSTPTACILSVTQESPSPTQDATAVISF